MNRKLKNFFTYGSLGVFTAIAVPTAINHAFKERPLITKEQFNELYSNSGLFSSNVDDYSRGGNYSRNLFIKDWNNDGVADALCPVPSPDSPLCASWYTPDWKGRKYSDAKLMAPKMRELATQQLRARKSLSLELLEEAIRQQTNQNKK